MVLLTPSTPRPNTMIAPIHHNSMPKSTDRDLHDAREHTPMALCCCEASRTPTIKNFLFASQRRSCSCLRSSGDASTQKYSRIATREAHRTFPHEKSELPPTCRTGEKRKRTTNSDTKPHKRNTDVDVERSTQSDGLNTGAVPRTTARAHSKRRGRRSGDVAMWRPES